MGRRFVVKALTKRIGFDKFVNQDVTIPFKTRAEAEMELELQKKGILSLQGKRLKENRPTSIQKRFRIEEI